MKERSILRVLMGMDVVAEGVETREQLEILRALGCKYGQGYFFSKPLDTQDAEGFICETYSPTVKVLEDMTIPVLARSETTQHTLS